MEEMNTLKAKDLLYLLVGFTLGPGFLRLPNNLIQSVHEDAWISAIIGLLYPLYITVISLIIVKNNPNKSLIDISTDIFGKVLGNMFMFMFLLQFIFFTYTITTELILILRIYIVAFLTPLKISFACIIVCLYAASKGIKVLSGLSEIALYMICFAVILSLFALYEGSLMNIRPILNTNIKELFAASFECLYYYSGFEVITLIHHKVEDKSNLTKYIFLSLLVSGFIWIWTVLITTLYLGTDITSRTVWSFILVYESIEFPIINNFRYIFMFLWIFVSFRIISNYLYISSTSICSIFKFKYNFPLYIICGFVFYLSSKNLSLFNHDMTSALIAPLTIFFNCTYITLISILGKLKKGK